MKRGYNQRTDPVPWTEEEDRKLLKLVEKLPRRRGGDRLARGAPELLGPCFPFRSLASVLNRYKLIKQRLRLGLKGFYQKPWTDEDVGKLRELYSQERFHLDLKGAFPDRHRASVITKAGRLGLTRPRLWIVPFKLSSEEAAMAAGLILGDGTIGRYRYKGR